MNVLVISDDYWHPGEVIVRGLRSLEKMGYTLDHVWAAKDVLTKKMIRNYDVIINAKTDAHSPANDHVWFEKGTCNVMPEDFKDYISEGHGFIALHSGNSFKRAKTPAMTDLIGNEFLGHPAQCSIEAKAVGSHPIMEGVDNFVIRDEHYMIDVYADDAVVFMETTSDSEAGTQIAGYTRSIGKGRLVVLTPGHNCSVFEEENYIKVIANAIDWAAGKK